MKNKKIGKKDCFHIDVMENIADNIATTFKKSSDGFLDGQAIVTNVGVFTYRDKRGGFIRELRPPEEVFDEESIASLQMLPLTNGHPPVLVDENNIKKYQKGFSGDSITKNEYALSVPLKWTDKKTIMDIEEKGKNSISCGYTADLEFTPGNWMGVPYDAIQRNIRYNHIAAVDKGRAGDLVKMRFDSDDFEDTEIYIMDINQDISIKKVDDTNQDISTKKVDDINQDKQNEGGSKMPDNLKKIILDNVEYQAESEVIKAYNKALNGAAELNNQLEKIKKDFADEKSKLEADRDSFKDKFEDLEKKSKEIQLTDEQIQAAVKERIDLIENAKKADVEVKDEMSNLGLKKEVVLKLFPKANLDGKDEIYINARYDSALEMLEEKKNDDVILKNNLNLFQNNFKKDKENEEFYDSNEAYKKFVAGLENAWKQKVEN